MNVYIFAIGGTGARVLRSLSFLLASGIEGIPDGTNFIPVIIDMDKTNGDMTRTIEDLESYMSIRKSAYSGIIPEKDEHNFFMPNLQYLADVAVADGKQNIKIDRTFKYSFGLDKAVERGTFADYLDYQFMMNDTYLTKDLLSSLYNDQPTENSFSELNLKLDKGFKGNPNIGCIVFENIKTDPEFLRFQNAFDPTQDRIFIISSIFGGTGSSGFPQVVDAIRGCGIAGFDTALMGAVIVMPYFKVNTPRDGGAINSNIFNSKQKAALSQYNLPDGDGMCLYDKITTTYFISDDNPTNLPYSEGNASQKNDAHIVELLSAASIINFAVSDANYLRDNNRRFREFGLEKDVTSGQPIDLTYFNRTEKEMWLNPLVRMALAFRFYKEYVLTEKINSRDAWYGSNGLNLADDIGDEWHNTLKKFIDDFDEWLDELASQKEAFKPFFQKPRDPDSNDPVAEDLTDYLCGYNGSNGNFMSSGNAFKGFSERCSHYFNKLNKYIDNDGYLFLLIMYLAAKDCFDKYKLNN